VTSFLIIAKPLFISHANVSTYAIKDLMFIISITDIICIMSSNPYINSVSVNLFKGIFNSEIAFTNGLNIISGENGTGKTQLISQLRSGARTFNENNTTNNIVVFNPLRNAEKKTQEQIRQKLRSQDLSIKKINKALKGFAINDQQLAQYYSFPELFILAFEEMVDEGDITKEDAVVKIEKEFNMVLKQVFPQYGISAKWSDKQLVIFIKKENDIHVPIESISRGESEVFALIFNIYANRNEVDIFLIDEPEIHLNWMLESGLFSFLNWFCNKFNKQIITTSHSRVVFSDDFISKTQFLVWRDDKIVVKSDPTEESRQRIGGDALKLVTALDISKHVFYVEDSIHNQVVEYLAKHYKKDVHVAVAKNKTNVENLCRYFKSEGLDNAFFLVDGDNEGVGKEFRNNNNYIKLEKYSLENYFLKIDILTKLSGKSKSIVNKSIEQSVLGVNEHKHIKVFKKLASSSELSEDIMDTYDASRILLSVSKKLNIGKTKAAFIRKYLDLTVNENRLEIIFHELTKVISNL
jgi:predicted ATPase